MSSRWTIFVTCWALFPWNVRMGPAWGDDPPVRFERIVLTDQYYCDGVTAGDIDADGHTDIVAGPFWYRGPDFRHAHAFYEPVPLPREPSPSNSMFSFVHDFNGDGLLDILVLGRVHLHEAKWYENPGDWAASNQRGHAANSSAGYWNSHFAFERVRGESPTMTDIDGDGQVEVICHWDGRWGWIEPDPSDCYSPWRFHPVGQREDWPQFYHGEGVGDINGDGRLDLIINDGWYEHPESSRGTRLWKFHRQRFSSQRGGAQMFVDDVDGDGDHDVISSVHAHAWGLAWYQQDLADDQRSFTERLIMGDRSQQQQLGAAFSQPHALDLADIDGDGLNDIVCGKRMWAHGPQGDIEPAADPVVYWFRLTRETARTSRAGSGPPQTATTSLRYVPYQIDDHSGVGVQILAADVDGDRRVDVLTASKLGTFLFRNLGK